MTEEKDKNIAFEVVKNTPYLQHLGIELVEIEVGKAVMKMPMKNELRQPYGLLHGGATASLIDTATAFAVVSVTTREEKCTTVDLTVHYLRPVIDETTICTATIVRAGKRLITVSAEVHNEHGKLIATALSTYAKI
ncbi:MAG TPA: PaaI family thioesterase [Pyrinomonadaceae bacterium]|nr:PaaI family thioesterase [Pyrinomonadaceae bacterium]